jgi:hypothetical protein
MLLAALIQAGADVNIRDPTDNTLPLYWVCRGTWARVTVARLLTLVTPNR